MASSRPRCETHFSCISNTGSQIFLPLSYLRRSHLHVVKSNAHCGSYSAFDYGFFIYCLMDFISCHELLSSQYVYLQNGMEKEVTHNCERTCRFTHRIRETVCKLPFKGPLQKHIARSQLQLKCHLCDCGI